VIDGECTVNHCCICLFEKESNCICDDCFYLRTPIPHDMSDILFPPKVTERIRTV